MKNDINNNLYEIFPNILRVVDRNATISWKLNDTLPFYNLMLIYDGKVEFTRNNAKFQATRGDLVYFKPDDIRKAHTFSDNLMKAYAVDFLYTCPICENKQWKLIELDLPFSSIQRIEDEYLFSKLMDLFSKLSKSYLSSKDKSDVKGRAILIEILTYLFKYKEGNHYSYSNIRKVDKIISYMSENYAAAITLQDLANYAQISSSYLGNIFKKVTGKSTIDYLISIRINKAKELLLDGFSVSETSKLVGFNDIFYFSKCFKKYEGMSPTQYLQDFTT